MSETARPQSTEEVAELLRSASASGRKVIAVGGGTGLADATRPDEAELVLSTARLKRLDPVDVAAAQVTVGAGVTLAELEAHVRAEGFEFPVDLGARATANLGGMAASNAGGSLAWRFGSMRDLVTGVEAVLADGSVVGSLRGLVKDNAGYDLRGLLVGSEGTLGVITDVWLRAHPVAPHTAMAAYSLSTMGEGIDLCRRVVRSGATPAVLRLYDAAESQRSHGGDGSRCTLLVLDEGEVEIVSATMAVVHRNAVALGARIEDTTLVERWLEHRNDTSGLQAVTRKGYVVDTMEVAGSWSALDRVYADVRAAITSVDGARSASAHLSHSYLDGACLYFTFAGDKGRDAEALYVAMWDAGQRAALAAGANLSHHHGVGLNRSRFVAEALGSSLGVLRAVKHALDPHGILNPGKLGLDDEDVWP